MEHPEHPDSKGKHNTWLVVLPIVLAVAGLIFGDNLYERFTGHSIFEPFQQKTIVVVVTATPLPQITIQPTTPIEPFKQQTVVVVVVSATPLPQFTVQPTMSIEQKTPRAQCAAILADSRPIEFRVSPHNNEDWRSWVWVDAVISVAKGYNAKDVCTYQPENRGYVTFFRFGLDEGATLYEANIPKTREFTFGSCWNKIKELPGFTYSTDQGISGTVEKTIIYIQK